jgi:hypothetical protein
MALLSSGSPEADAAKLSRRSRREADAAKLSRRSRREAAGMTVER